MSLFNKKDKEDKPESNEAVLTIEEINQVVSSSQYSKSDSIQEMVEKYKALCMLKEKCDDKKQEQTVFDAQWVFVNSIQMPRDKQEILDFIINTMPFAMSSSMETATSIGMNVLKKVTPGFVGNIVGKVGSVVQDAIASNNNKLKNIWRDKLTLVFKEGGKLAGGGLFSKNKDADFSSQLKDLKRQFDENCHN